MSTTRAQRFHAATMTVVACAGHALGQCTPQWIPMPQSEWLDAEVKAMVMWNDEGRSPGPTSLVVTGNFVASTHNSLRFVGRWNGQSWSPMGFGLMAGSGICATIHDPDGMGPMKARPVVGGVGASTGGQPVNTPSFWLEDSWETVGGGIAGSLFPDILCIASLSNQLFIGGFFESAGGVYVNRSARWDGTQWHATDLRWVNGGYYAMHVHLGQLFFGGTFGLYGQPPSRGVLRWTGSQLDHVDGAPSGGVFSLTSYQGKLFAGGFFFNEPGQSEPGNWIAQWDGNSWGPLGLGMNSSVRALTTFDPDGPGPLPELLIAGGWFSMAGGVPASRIAAWDGTQWMPLGTGVNGSVQSLCVYQNQLYVGGQFTTAGGQASPFLARWGCPQPFCYANCDQSTGAPSLTANDFMCFLNAYARGDASANCDASTGLPSLTANDFACFINKYAAGCS